MFLLISVALQGFAQNYPVTGINITLSGNPDPNTANWGTGKSMLIITASTQALNGRVAPQVMESKLLVTIKKGGSKACGSYTNNTAPASNFNTITKVWSGTNAVSYLGKECVLTPGDYELCVRFFGDGPVGLAPLCDEKCKPFTIIAHDQQSYQAPQPIAPANESELSESVMVQPIIFRWIPVTPRPQEPVTYRLKVWQLMQGQNGTQAMNVNQPVFTKDVENITQTVVTNLLTGSCTLPNLCSFIWNVQAIGREEKPIGENNGLSKPYVFSAITCECGTWGSLLVQNGAIVLKYDGESKIEWKCNQPFNFSGSYRSTPNNDRCQAKTAWNIRSGEGSVIKTGTGSGNISDSCRFTSNGSYTLTLNGACNGKTCNPSVYTIVVNDCQSCDCGKWSNSVIKIQGKRDSTTTSVRCNESISLTKGFYNFQFADFICDPNNKTCEVSYHWSVEGVVSGNGTGQTFSFGFSLPGNYMIAVTPICGGKKCLPCNFTIVIPGTLSPPDDPKEITDCKNYIFELRKIYRGDSIAYDCTITNKNTDAASNPKSLRIKIRKDSVIQISGNIPKEWSRTPSKFPPGSVEIKWTNNSGDIPQGETKLGTLYFAVPASNPFYVIYEWLKKEGKIICKDSLKLTDTRFYYELEKEPSGIYTEIANDILRIQFFNKYAAIENLNLSIYDVGIRKVKRKSGNAIKLNSVTGLNRISIDIKDYNLEPGRPYLLRVSDYYSHYHFNFKVTNDREK